MKLLNYNVPRIEVYMGLGTFWVIVLSILLGRAHYFPKDFSEPPEEPIILAMVSSLALLEAEALAKTMKRATETLVSIKEDLTPKQAYLPGTFTKTGVYFKDTPEYLASHSGILSAEKDYARHQVTQGLKGRVSELKDVVEPISAPSDLENLEVAEGSKMAQNSPKMTSFEKTAKPTKTLMEPEFSPFSPLEPKKSESLDDRGVTSLPPQRLVAVSQVTKPEIDLNSLPLPLRLFVLNARKRLKEGKSTSKILREHLCRPGSTKHFEGDYLNDGKRLWEDLGLPIIVHGTEPYKPCDRSKKMKVNIEVPEAAKRPFSPKLVQTSEDYLRSLSA